MGNVTAYANGGTTFTLGSGFDGFTITYARQADVNLSQFGSPNTEGWSLSGQITLWGASLQGGMENSDNGQFSYYWAGGIGFVEGFSAGTGIAQSGFVGYGYDSSQQEYGFFLNGTTTFELPKAPPDPSDHLLDLAGGGSIGLGGFIPWSTIENGVDKIDTTISNYFNYLPTDEELGNEHISKVYDPNAYQNQNLNDWSSIFSDRELNNIKSKGINDGNDQTDSGLNEGLHLRMKQRLSSPMLLRREPRSPKTASATL